MPPHEPTPTALVPPFAILPYILKIEENNSLRKTAEECCISQPHLSQLIHSLEDELGYEIFTRTHAGMRLTQRGRAFVSLARDVMNSYNQMIDLKQESTKLISYNLGGTNSSLVTEAYVDLCALYSKRPNFQFSMENLTLIPLLKKLYLGEFHLGIISYSSKQRGAVDDLIEKRNLIMQNIATLTCNINLRCDHPALAGGFSLQRLWNYPFVDYIGRHYCEYPEIKNMEIINPSRLYFVSDRESRYMTVSSTDAFCIGLPMSPRLAKSLGIQSIPFPQLQMTLAHVRKQKRIDDISKRFLEILKDKLYTVSAAFSAP